MELSAATRDELASLSRRYGEPRRIDATIPDGFSDPIRRGDRFGEVLMAVRRPNGRLLVAIKTFYPRGAYRLPTGGIHHGEGVLDALVRETKEETGLDTAVRRFLATIAYRGASSPVSPPLFHTFAFLLDELGGTLGALDTQEQIEDWREMSVAEVRAQADVLDQLATEGTQSIGGSWADWGRFRAVAHRAVADALDRAEISRAGTTDTRG
ncbi:MAG TPA: NUDIX hydrolase [Candidatus Limnocylindria bacterium]|nr:NUDIX hydrolase [Candidatus Limnocylindria bacterium]